MLQSESRLGMSFLSFCCLVGTVLFVIPLQAQNSSVGRFLYIQPSARGNSMGGTGVALYGAGSSFEAYYNPAALVHSTGHSLTLSGQQPLPFFTTRHLYGSVSVKIAPHIAAGVSANLLTEGYHERTADNGTILGTFASNSSLLAASFAYKIENNLALGLTLGMMNLNVAPAIAGSTSPGSSSALALSIAALYSNLLPQLTYTGNGVRGKDSIEALRSASMHRGISVGLSLNNLGPKPTFTRTNYSADMPSTLCLGAAYSPVRTESEGVLFALDFEKRLFESQIISRVHAGTELSFVKFLCVRAGYNLDPSNSQTSYLTAGAGIRLPFLQLNLARYVRTLTPTWQLDATFIWEVL